MTGMVRRLRDQARARAAQVLGGSQRGQSVLELAIFLPLILVFGLVCIQFAVIFIAYINVLNVTRDAARWVAVHPHVTDSSTVSTIKTASRLPPGITASALTITFSPTCTTLASGKCIGRDAGVQISATSTYTITQHLFLPSSFGWGSWRIAIPQTLPAYTINMQVEPN
jgi:Flp pilus assembly protein TadG